MYNNIIECDEELDEDDTPFGKLTDHNIIPQTYLSV